MIYKPTSANKWRYLWYIWEKIYEVCKSPTKTRMSRLQCPFVQMWLLSFGSLWCLSSISLLSLNILSQSAVVIQFIFSARANLPLFLCCACLTVSPSLWICFLSIEVTRLRLSNNCSPINQHICNNAGLTWKEKIDSQGKIKESDFMKLDKETLYYITHLISNNHSVCCWGDIKREILKTLSFF